MPRKTNAVQRAVRAVKKAYSPKTTADNVKYMVKTLSKPRPKVKATPKPKPRAAAKRSTTTTGTPVVRQMKSLQSRNAATQRAIRATKKR